MNAQLVTITGLDRTLYREPTAQGHLILAHFNAVVGPFTLKGCWLVRQSKGTLAVWLPNLSDKRQRGLRYITLHDEPTRSSLLQHALQMYRRLGGTDAERPVAVEDVLPRNVLPPAVERVSVKEPAE
jgi:hypothetical protein